MLLSLILENNNKMKKFIKVYYYQMKFIKQIVHYGCRNSEECGMFAEKMVCEITGVKFKSKRRYMNASNDPVILKNDIEDTAKTLLQSLDISEHLGNENKYYDFQTKTQETVSLKTNFKGYKVCPQIIGQVSLKNFNVKTGNDFKSNEDFKRNVLENPIDTVNLYLSYLFCCNHTISLQFEQGVIHYFKTKGKVSLSNETEFNFSQTLETWKESMTLRVKIDDKYMSLCEFQIHNNRNCIKCRFNMDTIITLIEINRVSNVLFNAVNLNYKYKIDVKKSLFKDL